jgi:MazG family protein
MSEAYDRLREVIARLRAPGGCPWDREQTPSSLIPSLIEEAHEVADAIERAHSGDLEEELGDLLINVLMQAEIAAEGGGFTAETVAATAAEKLIRRHPHVFGTSEAGTSDAVLAQWEEIKKAERLAKETPETPDSLLDGVPLGFPALVRAQKIQKKAAKAGFDWERPEDVLPKIREELAEVEEEMSSGDRERLAEEVGDLFFSVVNLARALSLDSESLLRAATGKFERRFRAMEGSLPKGREFRDLTFAEMDVLWEKAKSTTTGHEPA